MKGRFAQWLALSPVKPVLGRGSSVPSIFFGGNGGQELSCLLQKAILIKHCKCNIPQLPEHLRAVYWVYMSCDCIDTSAGSAWRAGSKLRGRGGMFYPESSSLTVTGLTWQVRFIVVKNKEVNKNSLLN